MPLKPRAVKEAAANGNFLRASTDDAGLLDTRGGRWAPEVLQTARGDVPLEAFIDTRPDVSVVALKVALDTVRAARGIELVRTEWLQPLGRGLHFHGGKRIQPLKLSAMQKSAGRSPLQHESRPPNPESGRAA
jgi:hypothetical protein